MDQNSSIRFVRAWIFEPGIEMQPAGTRSDQGPGRLCSAWEAPLRERIDSLIIGDGPCGLLAAALLASWGRRVLVLGTQIRAVDERRELLPGSAIGILERSGLLEVARSEGGGPDRRLMIWGDGEPRWTSIEETQRDFFVDRADLRAAMLAGLGREAVEILAPAKIIGQVPIEGRGAVDIALPNGRRKRIDASSIVIAAGRRSGPELMPMSLESRLTETTLLELDILGPAELDGSQVVEALPAGCLFWLAGSDGRARLSLLVDTDELRRRGAEWLFRAGLIASSGPPRHFAGRAPNKQVDVTPRLLRPAGGLLLAGDAASTLDPLQARGLEKALLSGESVAVCVNTLLERPEERDDLIRDHFRREHCRWLDEARRSLYLYALETRFSDQAFWRARHEAVRIEREAAMPAREDGADEASPPALNANPALERRRSYRRRGRVYEAERGFGLADAPEVHVEVMGLPIAPILDHVRSRNGGEELIEALSKDRRIPTSDRKLLSDACRELERLGLVVSKR